VDNDNDEIRVEPCRELMKKPEALWSNMSSARIALKWEYVAKPRETTTREADTLDIAVYVTVVVRVRWPEAVLCGTGKISWDQGDLNTVCTLVSGNGTSTDRHKGS
jgi:hypothetical protein